jgi:hypothetical protein
MSTAANIEANYDQNRMKYLAAQETIDNLREALAKVERQQIGRFINDARVFASTLTTFELTVKGNNLKFTEINR